MGTSSLQRAIEGLETTLDPASNKPAIDELAHIRRDLAEAAERKPRITLPNLRLSFACKQRWEDMVGDNHVRACNSCDRPVFNLSAMTRAEAERLLATRGLTPCVRFYRRPDGTIMTTDCPTGERREKRRLAVVATSLAAGATLAAPSIAFAEESPDSTVTAPDTNVPDDSTATEPDPLKFEEEKPGFDDTIETGGIPDFDHDDRFDDDDGSGSGSESRPAVEWSVWARFGVGLQTQPPANVLARSLTPPEAQSLSTWEAALAADATVGVANHGNIRLGAFAELRTSSGPVAGGELVLVGLPPHPASSQMGGGGTLVLRAGGNAHVFTTALGVGYVGSFSRTDPWIKWAKHVVGARFVASVNRSLDDPRDWSATFGLEVEPLGVLHAVFDFATEH